MTDYFSLLRAKTAGSATSIRARRRSIYGSHEFSGPPSAADPWSDQDVRETVEEPGAARRRSGRRPVLPDGFEVETEERQRDEASDGGVKYAANKPVASSADPCAESVATPERGAGDRRAVVFERSATTRPSPPDMPEGPVDRVGSLRTSSTPPSPLEATGIGEPRAESRHMSVESADRLAMLERGTRADVIKSGVTRQSESRIASTHGAPGRQSPPTGPDTVDRDRTVEPAAASRSPVAGRTRTIQRGIETAPTVRLGDEKSEEVAAEPVRKSARDDENPGRGPSARAGEPSIDDLRTSILEELSGREALKARPEFAVHARAAKHGSLSAAAPGSAGSEDPPLWNSAAPAPSRAAMARDRRESEADRTVQVTIGRIEIREQRIAPPPPVKRAPQGRLALRDYLSRRMRGPGHE